MNASEDPGQRIARTIESYREELQASLTRARARFDHPGNKGDDVEVAFRSFIGTHLPRNIDVGHGEIIDRFGARSTETDIVLSTVDQPFLVPQGQAGLYLVEAVAGVGEVKSAITSTEIDDIARKGRRFRELCPDTTYLHSWHYSGTTPTSEDRFAASPPYFAVAAESRLSEDAILKRLSELELTSKQTASGTALPCIDALFVLDLNCAFVYTFGQSDYFRVLDDTGDDFARGWRRVAGLPALTGLFMWLNMCLIRRTIWTPLAGIYMLTDPTH